MTAKISIITPSYNQGRFLEQNILSVVSQNYPNVEHIIIDGGSTDNTRQILEQYKDKLAFSISEPDKGQSDAVNKGFAKATGEIIGWLNSDDYYAPGALHAVSKAFTDPSVNVVCGYSILFDDKGRNEKAAPTVSTGRGLEFHLRFPDINQPPTFFRRNIMAEIMPLNTSLRFVMDREMWMKYIQLYSVKNAKTIDDILVYFRYHSTSNSQTKVGEFDDEYATILHWLATYYKLTEVTELLASKYKLNLKYSYSFNKYPDKETTMNMVRYFFLKKDGLVFNEAQFEYAKKGYKVLDIKHYHPLPGEKKAMARMESIVNHVNWTHFRIIRKIKSFNV
ncbi:MAG: glycosyltransferase family 2 protein [Bacteroidia bacterium]